MGYIILLCPKREFSLLFIKAEYVNYKWLSCRFWFFYSCWVYSCICFPPLSQAMPPGLGR